MESKKTVYVWPGERKLLPISETCNNFKVRCLNGKGYLRSMVQPQRRSIELGSCLTIPAAEVATVSAIDNNPNSPIMVLEISDVE